MKEAEREEPTLMRLPKACAEIDGMRPATARKIIPGIVRVGGRDYVVTAVFREWLNGLVDARSESPKVFDPTPGHKERA
jgi:hypothetical protein